MVWSADRNHPLRILAGWWLTAIASAVLVLPSIGPLLDHHYVERLPDHTHTYSGDVTPAHVHSYEVPGHLDHVALSRDILLQAGDLLYMARDNGAAYAPRDPGSKLNPDHSAYSGLQGRDLLALFARGSSPLVSAFIPPPWTPPRSWVPSR